MVAVKIVSFHKLLKNSPKWLHCVHCAKLHLISHVNLLNLAYFSMLLISEPACVVGRLKNKYHVQE